MFDGNRPVINKVINDRSFFARTMSLKVLCFYLVMITSGILNLFKVIRDSILLLSTNINYILFSSRCDIIINIVFRFLIPLLIENKFYIELIFRNRWLYLVSKNFLISSLLIDSFIMMALVT